jgi:hypothetical protein
MSGIVLFTQTGRAANASPRYGSASTVPLPRCAGAATGDIMRREDERVKWKLTSSNW